MVGGGDSPGPAEPPGVTIAPGTAANGGGKWRRPRPAAEGPGAGRRKMEGGGGARARLWCGRGLWRVVIRGEMLGGVWMAAPGSGLLSYKQTGTGERVIM